MPATLFAQDGDSIAEALWIISRIEEHVTQLVEIFALSPEAGRYIPAYRQ